MCARILYAVASGFGVFVGAWFVLMNHYTGPRYIPATWVTLFAAGAGLLAAGLVLVLAGLPRGEAQAPDATPARKLTTADIMAAYSDPPAPPPPTRPQPQTLPEDHAQHWLILDGKRVVWHPDDVPATPATPAIIGGRRAFVYYNAQGKRTVVYADEAR